jgi:hypothetical protein
MSAVLRVHEVTLAKDSDTSEGQFRVKLPDGREIGIFSSGSVSVYVPKWETDGEPCRYFEEVDITLPRTMDDIAARCDQSDNAHNFDVPACHRH